MTNIIMGGILSALTVCILAMVLGVLGEGIIQLLLFVLAAALPGMVIGGVVTLHQKLEALTAQIDALREEISSNKEKT